MNDKLIWLGRFLGSEFINTNIPNKRFKLNALDLAVLNLENEDIKLILKELEDISEEDLKECGFDWSDMDFARKEFLKRFDPKTLSNKESLFDFIDEIDFLRSQSYAIGIPKEYYITEKELEGMI